LFEWVGQGFLIGFGVANETALGFMFLLHFFVLIPITLMGLYFTTRENITLNQISKETSASKTKSKTKKTKARK
ncbi:MAG TPA: hypothetical protein VK791_06495, partial [bacterium]|nr:hypothetical protein [bacterium]